MEKATKRTMTRTREITREDVRVGQRVVFVEPYDVYPFVELVGVGAVGTIVEVDEDSDFLWVSLDEVFDGYDAEMWKVEGWPVRGVQIHQFFEFNFAPGANVLEVLDGDPPAESDAPVVEDDCDPLCGLEGVPCPRCAGPATCTNCEGYLDEDEAKRSVDEKIDPDDLCHCDVETNYLDREERRHGQA